MQALAILGTGVAVSPVAAMDSSTWVWAFGASLTAFFMFAMFGLVYERNSLTVLGVAVLVMGISIYSFSLHQEDAAKEDYAANVVSEVESEYGVKLYQEGEPLSSSPSYSVVDPSLHHSVVTVGHDDNLYHDAYLDISGDAEENSPVEYKLFVKEGVVDDQYVEFSEIGVSSDE